MINFLKDFKNNEDGLAAIEFALTLPLLTILYFGTIEASMMVETDRRVTSTASTIADLVSRTREVNYCEIEDIFYASSRIIRNKSKGQAKMRITSIMQDPVSGKNVVEWSQARNGLTAHANGTEMTIDAGIMPAAGSVIFAEVEFLYDTPFQYVFKSASNLSQHFYLRPRQSNSVEWIGPTTNPGNC